MPDDRAPRLLADLFHHRWSAPVLAELDRRPATSINALSHRIGGSRGGVRDALEWLIARGWVRHDPGHTHPLAPAYRLSPTARPLAHAVSRLLGSVREEAHLADIRRKWTAPILAAVSGEGSRHGEIRERVPGITDRALGLALRRMNEHGLLRHRLADEFPPAVLLYQPTRQGRRLQPLVRALPPLITRCSQGVEP